MRRPVLATATAALALSLGLAAPATAAPAPAPTVAPAAQAVTARKATVTRSTVSKIYWAVARDEQMRGWKRSDWRVQRVRVTSSGTWARATVHPTRGQTDDATVVLRKVKGRWRVVDLGTSQVGCGIAPQKVVRGLGLTGC